MNRSIAKLTGASAHTEYERPENDYYATDPNALDLFIQAFCRDGNRLNSSVWECACGLHRNLANYLIDHGYEVKATDLVFNQDFLQDSSKWKGDILTNPPFKIARQFVDHALDRIEIGNHVIMLLRIQFLEGKSRNRWLQSTGLKFVYVHSSRISIWLNNDRSIKGSVLCFAWFIWQKGFQGDVILKWIDDGQK